ncbi:hypothetical protein CN934_21200 [Ensifer sp. MMN_5]|nr:hypothetical protein CN934_21200 [Ensifer sp. MMN_5]PND29486.1 hypothetical protein CN933_05510 [Sinorhizobium sp. M4_45]
MARERGIVRTRDLTAVGVPRCYPSTMCQECLLVKVCYGLYRSTELEAAVCDLGSDRWAGRRIADIWHRRCSLICLSPLDNCRDHPLRCRNRSRSCVLWTSIKETFHESTQRQVFLGHCRGERHRSGEAFLQ